MKIRYTTHRPTFRNANYLEKEYFEVKILYANLYHIAGKNRK